MKHLLAALALFALAACGTIANPVSSTAIYNIENAYGVAQAAAVAYTRLPRCGVPPCSTHAVIVQLATADKNARLALDNAEAFVRTNPQLSASAAIIEAQNALLLFQQIEASYGVKTP
jgi:hypothetical protein